MKPSDFIVIPMSSVTRNFESEMIALNIMKILKRTGNEFRSLSFEEYKIERLKDKDFSDREEYYFNQVIDFCQNAETAITFSPNWNKQ